VSGFIATCDAIRPRLTIRIPYPAHTLVPPAAGADSAASADAPDPGSSAASTRTRLDAGWRTPSMSELKIEFERSSDNQGRVTVYAVEVLGPA
jgi:hypothetical protein